MNTCETSSSVTLNYSDNHLTPTTANDITGSSTTTQFSRRGSRCWEDDEDEEDW